MCVPVWQCVCPGGTQRNVSACKLFTIYYAAKAFWAQNVRPENMSVYVCVRVFIYMCVCVGHTQPYAQQKTFLFAQACQKTPRRSEASKMKKEIKLFFFSAHALLIKKGQTLSVILIFQIFNIMSCINLACAAIKGWK